MNKKMLIKLIEEAIELDENTLSEEDALESVELWDSLAVVSFIAMVDEHFEVTLSAEKIAQSKTVKDLMNLLGDKISD